MIESGAVENTRTTTVTAKVDGKTVAESVKINKDTGKVLNHTVDGKPVEEKKEEKKKEKQPVRHNPGNTMELVMLLLIQNRDINIQNGRVMQKIRENLQELNYRHNQVHPLDDEKVREGIKLG